MKRVQHDAHVKAWRRYWRERFWTVWDEVMGPPPGPKQ